MRRRRFGGGFGRGRRSAPVIESQGVQTGSRTKCWGCSLHINVGEPFIRLRLRKHLRLPCATCGQQPKGAKRFHVACRPPDVEKAMGYNPAAHVPPPQPDPWTPPSAKHQVPPPPKPPTADEAALQALVAIENAIKVRSRGNPTYQKEIETIFKTYQGCKSRALRPGTPDEGLVAMKMAIKKALDLVF